MPAVPSQGWDVRYRNRLHTPFLPSSFCLGAEAQGPQGVRLRAGVPHQGPPRPSGTGPDFVSGLERVLFLRRCRARSGGFHGAPVCIPQSQGSKPPTRLACLEKGWQEPLGWGRRKTQRISPCSHPDLGDKSTLLVVLKPEEVCLPQPTPARFYIVRLKQSLPRALALIGRFSQGGQKRGRLQRRSRNPGLGLRQSGEHLLGSP